MNFAQNSKLKTPLSEQMPWGVEHIHDAHMRRLGYVVFPLDMQAGTYKRSLYMYRLDYVVFPLDMQAGAYKRSLYLCI